MGDLSAEATMQWRTPVFLLAVAAAACFDEATRPGGGGNPVEPPLAPIQLVLPRNSGAGQVGPVASYLPNPLVARVVQGGIPVPGIAVQWHIVNPSSRIEPLNEVSDANGYVSARYFTAETSGEQSAIAFVGTKFVGFLVSATPGPPASLRRMTPFSDTIRVGFALYLKLKVQDHYGNGVPGVAADWTIRNTEDIGILTIPPRASSQQGIDSSAIVFKMGPDTVTVTASMVQYPSITPITFQIRGTVDGDME